MFADQPLAPKAAKRKPASQTVDGIPEGEQRVPPPPQPSFAAPSANADFGEPGANQDKFALCPDDPANFLKICSALRILIRRRLTDPDIDRADALIREYCTELIPVSPCCLLGQQANMHTSQLYGSVVMKPNHHYATHVSDCARNFGPLHDFWTFLFERLNKVLKSYRTNNHAQGELEVMFFNEFHKTCRTSRVVCDRTFHFQNAELF
jgi:hypothetical protein